MKRHNESVSHVARIKELIGNFHQALLGCTPGLDVRLKTEPRDRDRGMDGLLGHLTGQSKFIRDTPLRTADCRRNPATVFSVGKEGSSVTRDTPRPGPGASMQAGTD